jgi:broad specificity phosphatase PhoE
MIIKLVRHGESLANTGEMSPEHVGDHRIPLSRRGRGQARAAGSALTARFIAGALVYTSPYLRARQTLAALIAGTGLSEAVARRLTVYEDPRLREVEHGYGNVDDQQALRRVHGWFYYRYAGGESPADCYDRTSTFLEGMLRQVERKRTSNVLIVTHGLTIRCFVMRFLHLTVEQFETLANPANCDIITLAWKASAPAPQFVRGRWGVWGLRLRDPGDERRPA